MESELLRQLAGNGVFAVLLALALLALRAKDRELKAEMQKRIEDAQEFNKLSLELQDRATQTVHKVSQLIEWNERGPRRRNPSPKDDLP